MLRRTVCGALKILRFLAVAAVIIVPLIVTRRSWTVFSWLSQGNYTIGLTEFLLGAMGALLAAYLLLGVLLPPMGEVRATRDELNRLKELQQDLSNAREQYVNDKSDLPSFDFSAAQSLSADLEKTIGRLEQRLAAERRRFLRISILLYAAFGGLFSAALTYTPEGQLIPGAVWQALTLGVFSGALAIVLVFVKDWLERECRRSPRTEAGLSGQSSAPLEAIPPSEVRPASHDAPQSSG